MSARRTTQRPSLVESECAPPPGTPPRPAEPRLVWSGGGAFAEFAETIDRVAAHDATVLVTGETGTGKGLVARRIHRRSARAVHPFVHVDCASLATGVIESELFGHERGAYTGAHQTRIGRLELASAGTLFLDEISELDVRLQAKLLRVLQDRRFERVGGTRTLGLRARVVAATNADLPSAIASGRFRADLYYRLAIMEVAIPPLRARREQIADLVTEGLRRLAARCAEPPPAFTPAAIEALGEHTWPGNVRELMNVLERIAARWPGQCVDAETVRAALPAPAPSAFAPARARAPSEGGPGAAAPRPPPGSPEIARALAAHGGNIARAARALGMPRSTLRYRLRTAARHGSAHAAQLDLPFA